MYTSTRLESLSWAKSHTCSRKRAREMTSPGWCMRYSRTANSLAVRLTGTSPRWTVLAAGSRASPAAVRIGARVEAVHQIGNGLARREHEDRHPPPSLAELAADVETVDVGQPDVQDHRVEVTLAAHPHRILTAGLNVDRVAVLAERALQQG